MRRIKRADRTPMNVNAAILVAKKECKNEYAQAYLKAIPNAIESGGTLGLKIQLLYALKNMSAWRGRNARKAKKAMKEYQKFSKRKAAFAIPDSRMKPQLSSMHWMDWRPV